MVTFVNYVVPLCCASPVGASEEVLHRIGVPVGERGSNSTTVVGGLLRFFFSLCRDHLGWRVVDQSVGLPLIFGTTSSWRILGPM